MHPTRRKFLQTLSAGALAAGLPRWAYARALRSGARTGAGRARSEIPRVVDGRARRSEASRLLVRRHPLHAQPRAEHRRAQRPDHARRRRRRLRTGRRRDRDLRLRRARHPQRRLGICQQPARHAGRDQARDRHRDRRGARQRRGEEARRAARAGARLRRVLAGADPEGSVGGAARREDRHAPRRHRDDAEEHVGAVRGGVGRLRARVEVPRDQRRLVHRAGLPLHQLQPRRDRAHRQPGEDAQLRAARRQRLRVPRAGRSARQRRAGRRRSGRALDGEAGRPGAEGSRADAVAPRR